MNKIRRYSWIVIILFFPTELLGEPIAFRETPDGRFGTDCYNIKGLGGAVCEVPFVRLLATPERYDGKIIRVTGYLITVYGSPVLFANKASFDSGVDIEGIALKDAKIPKKIEKKIKSGVKSVYIVGRFDAKYDNEDKAYRLGRIEKIIEIDTWSSTY